MVIGAEPATVVAAGGDRALVAEPADLPALLDIRRRAREFGRVPAIDADPRWTIVFEGLPATREQADAMESLTTLANGTIGTRGVFEDDGEGTPMVVAPGVFDERGDTPTLLPGPNWTSLVMRTDAGATDRRTLDLRTGMLTRERTRPRSGAGAAGASANRSAFRTLRFIPLTEDPSAVLLAEGPASTVAPGHTLHLPRGHAFGSEGHGPAGDFAVVSQAHGGIAAFGDTRVRTAAGIRTIERLVGFAVDGGKRPRTRDARRAFARTRAKGTDELIREHRAAWAQRWADAEVSIVGDPSAELAARFALFHLLASVQGSGEAPVGPRGLSGIAYGGHVLWDADIYALPPLAATYPRAARAMLEYRLRRLAKARGIASTLGYKGARFPWESGRDGSDVTPHLVRRSGQIIPILTGWREEHVVADVAWAAVQYADWTGDDEFLLGPGSELVIECARYWAGRVRRTPRGDAHIFGVVGPDEYHEVVDDNAYTNGMARWNLTRAADIARRAARASPEEIDDWIEIAGALDVGYDPTAGIHEQFPGFWRLDRSIVASMPTRPVMADEVFGRAHVKESQIIKQPDVMMLHHLIPDDLAAGSLARDLDYYEPLTAHGSSLSPAIHASLLARAGRPDEAATMLSLASRLDLDDLTHTTGRGLHIATMGGVWQALAFGFMGMRPTGQGLRIDPALPSAWENLSLTVRFRGSRVRVQAGHDAIDIVCEHPTIVSVAGAEPILVEGSERVITIERDRASVTDAGATALVTPAAR